MRDFAPEFVQQLLNDHGPFLIGGVAAVLLVALLLGLMEVIFRRLGKPRPRKLQVAVGIAAALAPVWLAGRFGTPPPGFVRSSAVRDFPVTGLHVFRRRPPVQRDVFICDDDHIEREKSHRRRTKRRQYRRAPSSPASGPGRARAAPAPCTATT